MAEAAAAAAEARGRRRRDDPYTTLGIDRSADDDDIKRAYRRLATRCHPDRLPPDATQEQRRLMTDRFERITEAKELLLDPARRLRFDQFGVVDGAGSSAAHAYSGNSGGAAHQSAVFYMDYSSGNDIFNLFLNSMFGGNRNAFQQQQQQEGEEKEEVVEEEEDVGYSSSSSGGGGGGSRSSPNERSGDSSEGAKRTTREGHHIVVPLQMDLQDLYRGTMRHYAYKRRIICPGCRGTGATSPENMHFCRACKGTGQRMMRRTLPRGVIQQFTALCSDCDGQGQIVTERCSVCKGARMVQQSKSIELRIRPGMESGHRIVLKRQGDEWPGRVTGDLVFTVHQIPHPVFTRKGADLHITRTVSLLESLTGFTMLIETLDENRWLRIHVDQIIQPGVCKAIDNEGMPVLSRANGDVSMQRRGRLIVEFQVQFPQHLNMEMKHYLRLFLDPEMYRRMMSNDQTLPLLKELRRYAERRRQESAQQEDDKKGPVKTDQSREKHHITIVDTTFAPGTFDTVQQRLIPPGSRADESLQQSESARKKGILSSICATQ